MREERGNSLRTYNFESSSHCGTVLSGLNSLRSKHLLFDVTLVVDAEKFQAHRVVLASCSEYFRAMFTDEMKESQQEEIRLNGVTIIGMQSLLDYAYTSRLTLHLGNVQQVLGAASHLQILPVVEACANYLNSQIELDNVVDIATIAETYTLAHLRKQAYRFMAQGLDKLAILPEFQQLTATQVEYLVSSDYPVECPEADVLQAVLCWIHGDMTCRASVGKHLLSHIKWKYISAVQLETVIFSPMVSDLLSSLCILKPAIDHGQEVVRQSNWLSERESTGLVNLRGMEEAIVNVGGFQSSTGMTNTLAYYHHSCGQWKRMTSIPHMDQCNFGVAVLGNELYVVGGCINQSMEDNVHPFGFRYNPRTDSWATIAPMLQERCGFYLGSLDCHLYAIGGSGEAEDPSEDALCERYDPQTNRWTELAPIPGCRKQHAGACHDSHIYACGGLDWDTVLSSLWCYDVDANCWTIKSPMPVARADHCMVADGNKLFVAGGWYEEQTTGHRVIVDMLDSYDIVTDQWMTITRVPTPRYLAGVVILDNMLYVIGGFGNGRFYRSSKKIESFDLVTHQWRQERDYPVAIWEHLSCVLYVPTCREDKLLSAEKSHESRC